MAFNRLDFMRVVACQLRANAGKNLFYEKEDGSLLLGPAEETVKLLNSDKRRQLAAFLRSAAEDGSLSVLVRDLSDAIIRRYLSVNQFLSFTAEDRLRLEELYGRFAEHVRRCAESANGDSGPIEALLARHYRRLKEFLLQTNGAEIFRRYAGRPELPPVVCSEYTPRFQLEVLGIALTDLRAPVLDLGCGPQAGLVRYLRANGIEAFGIDRNAEQPDFCVRSAGWFDLSLEPGAWGTIISHMAFTNHFVHHHYRRDGNAEGYARKYMEILHALKPGGAFVYAPRLPFIEAIIERTHVSFRVRSGSHGTVVTRV